MEGGCATASTACSSVRRCSNTGSTTRISLPWRSINSRASTMARIDYDVIVAGGGVAGISAAAALKEFGWSVLIVEPGQHSERRLGGELIHPAGVSGLDDLGLMNGFGRRGATSIGGFVVFPSQKNQEASIELPYVEGRGLALDHEGIRSALVESGQSLPYVEFLMGGRVVGIDDNASTVVTTIRTRKG